jgi:hypothetical protein
MEIRLPKGTLEEAAIVRLQTTQEEILMEGMEDQAVSTMAVTMEVPMMHPAESCRIF